MLMGNVAQKEQTLEKKFSHNSDELVGSDEVPSLVPNLETIDTVYCGLS